MEAGFHCCVSGERNSFDFSCLILGVDFGVVSCETLLQRWKLRGECGVSYETVCLFLRLNVFRMKHRVGLQIRQRWSVLV